MKSLSRIAFFWSAAGAIFWLVEWASATVEKMAEFGGPVSSGVIISFDILFVGLGIYLGFYIAAGLFFELLSSILGKRPAIARTSAWHVGWCITVTTALAGAVLMQADFLPEPLLKSVIIMDAAWQSGLLILAVSGGLLAMKLSEKRERLFPGLAATAFLAVWILPGYRGLRQGLHVINSAGSYLAFIFAGVFIAALWYGRSGAKARGARSYSGYAGWALMLLTAGMSLAAWTGLWWSSISKLKSVSATGPKPNILLVVLDTVRGDHLSCYGHTRLTSPVIDELASEGVLFEQVMSVSGWTLPSHASIFTGRFPSEHLATGLHLYLEPTYPAMAQLLYRAGYQTAGFSANPFVSGAHGLDRGFEYFKVVGSKMEKGRSVPVWRRWAWYLLEVSRRVFGIGWNWKERDFSSPFPPASLVIGGVNEWLENSRDKSRPFFIFINLMDAHMPYNAPRHPELESFFTDSRTYREALEMKVNPWEYIAGKAEVTERDFELLKKLYDSQIKYMDNQLKRLFDRLKNTGEMENTIVIITSDHGEYFGERGLMEHCFAASYPNLNLPLVLWGVPGEKSGRVKSLVQNIDILPTLLETLKIKWRGLNRLPGHNLLNPQSDRTGNAETYPIPDSLQTLKKISEQAAERFNRRTQVIWSGGYEYIWKENGESELYYLPEDLSEENNILAEHPLRAKKFQKMAEKRAKASSGKPAWQESGKGISKHRDTLKALGYVK